MSTKLGTLTLNLIAQIGSFTEPMKKAGDTAQRETKRIESSVSSASKAIAGLGAAALAGLTVGSVINMADEYTQMAARIRNATADTAEYDMVQKRLLETANGTYRSLSEAQEVYLSLAGGMKSLGKTTEETLNVADSLSYAFVANAARADQAQSAMDALNKSMAKGKIDADAWISIVSAADNIIADMAKVAGKTEAEIRQLGATGKIALSDLLTTLEVTKDANQALADNMENSLADGLQKVRNSFSAFVGEINVTYGVTSKMAGALSILADNLQTVTAAGGVIAAYVAGTYIPVVVKSTVAGYQKSRQLVEQTTVQYAAINAERAAAAAHLAQAEAQVINTQQTLASIAAEKALEIERLKAQMNAIGRQKTLTRMAELKKYEALVTRDLAAAEAQLAAAQARSAAASTATAGAGRAALGILGGPIGLGLTVATVAASYLLMRDNTDKSTESLRANNQTVADAVQKYKELGEVKQREQLVVEKEQLAALNDEYDNAASKLVSYSLKVARHSDMTREQAREVSALTLQYKSGAITLEDFSRSINSNKNITQQAKDEFNLFAGSVKTAGDEAGKQNSLIAQLESTLYGVANGGDAAAGGIRNATNALSEFAEKARQAGVVAKATNTLIAKGYNPKVAADLAELAVKNGQVSREEAAAILFKNQEQDKLNKTVEAYNKTHATSAVRSRTRTAAVREETKALRDQNRALEDARRLIYEYGSEFNRIETDLSEEINRIAGSSLKSASKNRMIEDAKEIAEARKKLYAAELDYELNQHQMTEREKLKAQLNIDKLSIDATKGLLDAERKLKKDALDAQSKIEQTAVRISQDKALLEIKRNWMTAGDYAREYYALVREEILNTASYSPEMKEALLQQAVSQQNFEQSNERDQAISDYRDVMGYEESPLVKQFEVLDKMRELDLISEEKYQQDKLMLQTKYSASYMESMLGGFAALVDENSSLYAGLFAAQKAFAVAQAMLNIPSAYSKAYDAVVGTPYVGPYIAPAIGAAAAALQVAQAASIKSVGLTGMAHDGINNIPEEGTWLLNKGERVLNPSQNRDLTNYLNQVQTGGQNRPIDNKLSVIMVKDEDEAKNYKYSKDFEDAVLYHMKRNRSKI
ncbi:MULTISPECIES: tape measure protein [unclassified Acinetobacter]|uniref:tape measure protein n=1 Tax=unclassified Acinetobacter TaxID=196816 RepID=UPI0015D22E42|nr:MULTISPECIES: tape measure protein [unclassified Acinetobacter]